MDADVSAPAVLNSISMNFPKREELSFRTVRAFPKDSRMGLDCRTVAWQELVVQSRKIDKTNQVGWTECVFDVPCASILLLDW